ncbi:MAG: radical SAM protein [Candidatus Krumholzibacteriota bacterium]|nr:radical SAM protein [Candidatus Krumholzibacteriota bacterium]
MKRIFGPVPSRRLGRSLGIDIIPRKTCSFDCIYCECGPTGNLTLERREFFPLEEITEEVERRLADIPQKPDALTLSGSGEPTLYSRMGELIGNLKRLSRVPVAVLTNSSLLDRPDVREELARADIVLPSLDTALPESFRRLNRPHPRCDIQRLIRGLEDFISGYKGRVYLEVLLVKGYNTDARNLRALKSVISRWKVDSVQLNTAVRPGTVKGIHPLHDKEMEKIRDFFGPRYEIIARSSTRATHEDRDLAENILSMIERRPCTVEDIHLSLGIPRLAVIKLLARLAEDESVIEERQGDSIFYRKQVTP